jgi:molybdopterin-synthase adenylyltransferase
MRLRLDVRLVRAISHGRYGLECGGKVIWLPDQLAEALFRSRGAAVPSGLEPLLASFGFLQNEDAPIIDRNFSFVQALVGNQVERCLSRLETCTFAVIGCGGLGSSLAVMLAALGARNLRLVDGDRIDQTNLSRLLWAEQRDVGKPKVDALGEHLRRRFGVSARAINAFVGTPHEDIDLRSALERVDWAILSVDQPAVAKTIVQAIHSGLRPSYVMAGYTGSRCAVGPIVRKSEDACPFCRGIYIEVQEHLDTVAPSAAPNNYFIASYLACQICLALIGASQLESARWTFDLRTTSSSLQVLKKNPHCGICNTKADKSREES